MFQCEEGTPSAAPLLLPQGADEDPAREGSTGATAGADEGYPSLSFHGLGVHLGTYAPPPPEATWTGPPAGAADDDPPTPDPERAATARIVLAAAARERARAPPASRGEFRERARAAAAQSRALDGRIRSVSRELRRLGRMLGTGDDRGGGGESGEQSLATWELERKSLIMDYIVILVAFAVLFLVAAGMGWYWQRHYFSEENEK